MEEGTGRVGEMCGRGLGGGYRTVSSTAYFSWSYNCVQCNGAFVTRELGFGAGGIAYCILVF